MWFSNWWIQTKYNQIDPNPKSKCVYMLSCLSNAALAKGWCSELSLQLLAQVLLKCITTKVIFAWTTCKHRYYSENFCFLSKDLLSLCCFLLSFLNWNTIIKMNAFFDVNKRETPEISTLILELGAMINKA